VAKSSERSLKLIRASGSTARVLNLILVAERFGESEEHRAKPLLQTPALNQALYLKHVLRPHERAAFDMPPKTTTKIVFPYSKTELQLGGRSVLVGERNFQRALKEMCGAAAPEKLAADIDLIQLLNSLPSFDPFLMRERLRQNGYAPSRCYFELSEADIVKMREFVASEIAQLVDLAFANGGGASRDLARKMADKLMTDETAKALDPLRMALQLSEQDYREGVFSWKGFIYYRWLASTLFPKLRALQKDILLARVNGADSEERRQLGALRKRVATMLNTAVERVDNELTKYGTAFAGLSGGDAAAFRNFLLGAPQLFIPIGEALGAIQHVDSFWRFRFPPGVPMMMDTDEAFDLFIEYETTLGALGLMPPQAERAA
jgi:hypothetical protein